MQYRIFRPVLFQRIYRQPREKLLSTLEIRLHSRYKKAFPEPAGTAQEIVTPPVGKIVNKSGLVHIDTSAFANLLKTLYSNRV